MLLRFKSLIYNTCQAFRLLHIIPKGLFVYFNLLLLDAKNAQPSEGINILIFSLNRPLQLRSLIQSFYYYNQDNDVDSFATIFVIYKHSYNKAIGPYQDVVQQFSHRNIIFINEGTSSFKALINSLPLSQKKYTTTLVDDIIFREAFSLKYAISYLDSPFSFFYLRLGLEIKTSFMQNSTQNYQPLLKVFKDSHQVLTWSATNILHRRSDWFYLLTLDGMICSTTNWRLVFKLLNYTNPSMLEAKLQFFSIISIFFRCLCFKHSIIVNLPFNLVQTEYLKNKNLGWSADFFLDLFNNGFFLDFTKVSILKFSSTHHSCNPTKIYSSHSNIIPE